MDTIFELFKSVNPEVLFIVVLSAYINKYVIIKAKFLVPLVLSLGCALTFFLYDRDTQILKLWFSYAGQSMILHELWKNYFKKLTIGRKE